MDELIKRINYLAQQSKERELSADEKAEQQQLRTEYLGMIRGQVKNHLASVKIVDEEGQDVTPDKLKELKNNNKKNKKE